MRERASELSILPVTSQCGCYASGKSLIAHGRPVAAAAGGKHRQSGPVEERALAAQVHLEHLCRPLEGIRIVLGVVMLLSLHEIVFGIRIHD